MKLDNVRVIPDAGDVEIVGADKIAKLSAETSEDRPVAAWDQRIVMCRGAQSSWMFGHRRPVPFEPESRAQALDAHGEEFGTSRYIVQELH